MNAKASGPQANPDWEKLQQQWWQALRAAGVPVAEQSASWLGEGWQGPIAAMGTPQDLFKGEAAERLEAATRQFLGWCNGLLAPSGATQAMPTSAAEWSNWMRQGAGPMFENMNPLLKLLQGAPFGGAGFEPAGFEKMFAAAGQPAEAMQSGLRDLLKLPNFGYSRESQERKQQMALALLNFQQALAAYSTLLQKISQQSFSRFESKLAEREEPGRRLDSIRAVYDLWIDAAEETYTEVALSLEFRQVYGNLVNCQMALRQQVQAEIERAGAEVGMPTRSELNSVHQRLHALRRQVRELEDRLDGAASRPAASTSAAPVPVAARAAKRAAPAAVKSAPLAPRRAPRSAAGKTIAHGTNRKMRIAKPAISKPTENLKAGNKPDASKKTGKPPHAKKAPAATARRALNRLA